MTQKALGYEGEARAAKFLVDNGYEILAQNWHTRWCEIDIIAKKDDRVYFVEVKSRSTNDQGSGFDYITAKKLKQMAFGANMWVHDEDWSGEYQLAAIAVAGDAVTFLEDLH